MEGAPLDGPVGAVPGKPVRRHHQWRGRRAAAPRRAGSEARLSGARRSQGEGRDRLCRDADAVLRRPDQHHLHELEGSGRIHHRGSGKALRGSAAAEPAARGAGAQDDRFHVARHLSRQEHGTPGARWPGQAGRRGDPPRAHLVLGPAQLHANVGIPAERRLPRDAERVLRLHGRVDRGKRRRSAEVHRRRGAGDLPHCRSGQREPRSLRPGPGRDTGRARTHPGAQSAARRSESSRHRIRHRSSPRRRDLRQCRLHGSSRLHRHRGPRQRNRPDPGSVQGS